MPYINPRVIRNLEIKFGKSNNNFHTPFTKSNPIIASHGAALHGHAVTPSDVPLSSQLVNEIHAVAKV